MIFAIKGKIHNFTGNKVIIENNGIFLEIQTPLKYSFKPNQEIMIYLVLLLNENNLNLYGFINEAERIWFNELLRISGIGPSIALSIISQMEIEEFSDIVLKQDIKALTKFKGIGRKTAERIILEMKDRIEIIPSIKNLKITNEFTQALNVLMSLGIDYQTSKYLLLETIKEKPNLSAEELVKTALSNLSSK
jgi:Holliday junction DNA helicase RuvA